MRSLVRTLALLGVAATAQAQEQAAEPQPLPTIPVEEHPEPAPPPIEEKEGNKTVLDSVVVTAQRRVERVQEVPVAVTVVNQKQLERANATQVTDLSRLAPSVEVNGQPGNADTRVSIRGISTESFSITSEQAVSLVVDGVVLGKAPSVSLFDIGRVEILRGPQGTLFGKNSSAGVISISTNPPDPGRFSAGARADLGGEFGYRLYQASVNLPLGDTAALRVNAGQTRTSGFYYNATRREDSEQDIRGARARFLWNLTPNLSLNLIADYEQQYTSEQIYLAFERFVNEGDGRPAPIPRCRGTFAGEENRVTCNNNPTFNDGRAWGYSMQLEWLPGDYALNSITSLRRYTQYNEIDVDGLNGNYYDNANSFNNRVFTQELRIASPPKRDFSYVAGLYYSNSHVPNFLKQLIGPDVLAALGTGTLPISICTQLNICLGEAVGLYQPNQYTADIESAAVFGQATYRLFDPLKVILGARYTRDDVAMTSVSFLGVYNGTLGSESPTVPQNEPLLGRDVVKALQWKTGLQYTWSRNLMGYFTVARGYKGPQIVFVPPNDIPSIGPPPKLPTPAMINHVRPEYPFSYELGIKSAWFGGLLAANLALFHTDIKDFQSSVFNGQASFTPNNIPHVVTKGFELDFLGFLSQNLTVSAGVLYNKVTYPHPYFVGCTQVGPKCPDTAEGTVEDVGGRQLSIAPKWKVTFSPEYAFNLPFTTRGFITTDVVYRSEMHFGASDDTRTVVPGHVVVGARAGIRGPLDNWEISVFGRNLTASRNPAFLFAPYLLTSASTPNQETSGHALSTESFRFFGVSLGLRF